MADCDLDLGARQHLRDKIDVVLTNSFGFKGTEGTLIFGRL